MEIYVLDSRNNYTPVGVIDSYTSLIWTKRYYNYGDFELYLPASDNLLDILRPDFFITRDDDDSVMVIEKIQIQTDAESMELSAIILKDMDLLYNNYVSIFIISPPRILIPVTVFETKFFCRKCNFMPSFAKNCYIFYIFRQVFK